MNKAWQLSIPKEKPYDCEAVSLVGVQGLKPSTSSFKVRPNRQFVEALEVQVEPFGRPEGEGQIHPCP
jgi:hypothetical protein